MGNIGIYDQYEVKIDDPSDPDGKNIKTLTKFDIKGMDNQLRENIRRLQFEKPTQVQKYVMALILERKQVMVCAQTGSGKTASFLIP